MVQRARSVEQTRAAILDAAADLFAGEGYADVSLDDISTAAGVSRGTIYHQFGTRQGLIEALTTITEEHADFARVTTAAESDDPARALVDTCVELVRFVHETAPLFDNLRSLAEVEAGLREMVERKDAARRDLIVRLSSRAAAADMLAVSEPRGRAVLTALTGYDALRELLTVASSVTRAQADIRWILGQLLHAVPAPVVS